MNENKIGNLTAIFNKQILTNTLNYTDVNNLDDYELWLGMESNGYTFYNLNEVLAKHRIHSNSNFNSSGKNSLFLNELKEYYKSYNETLFVSCYYRIENSKHIQKIMINGLKTLLIR